MRVMRWAAPAIVCLAIAGCTPGGAASPGTTSAPASRSAATSGPATSGPATSASHSAVQTPIRPPGASPFAPDLEALLPTHLAGSPTILFSVAGAHFENGGDICFYLCPGELTSLAKGLGLGIGQVDVALDVTQGNDLAILAIRVRGSDPSRLIPAWLEMKRRRYGHDPETLTIGGKSVVGVDTTLTPVSAGSDYMYVSGGVLFVLQSYFRVPPADVPALVAEAFAALP